MVTSLHILVLQLLHHHHLLVAPPVPRALLFHLLVPLLLLLPLLDQVEGVVCPVKDQRGREDKLYKGSNKKKFMCYPSNSAYRFFFQFILLELSLVRREESAVRVGEDCDDQWDCDDVHVDSSRHAGHLDLKLQVKSIYREEFEEYFK